MMNEQGKWAGLRGGRWARSDAEWAVAEWAGSGESVVAFCKRHEIRAKRLYDWRARLAKGWLKNGRKVVAAPSTLVPVLVRQLPMENTGVASSCPVVVSTGSARVEVRELSSTSRIWVAQLLGLGGE